jgi:hypothetical protein
MENTRLIFVNGLNDNVGQWDAVHFWACAETVHASKMAARALKIGK